MQLKQNKKGMTLIEIVVVLLISTIIMSIVGSMILSSMGYFSEEVVSQQDKEGLIDISSYIRKELSYATDVRVDTKKPTDDAWHWLSIKDGKLYKDDGQLLSDNYYQNRKITIKVHGFDNYRLDLNLKYLDNANKAVASNKTSLELMNLKASKDVDREYAPFSTAMDINETQKIYYIIKEKEVKPEPPAIDGEGTVEDELACLNNYNNREVFIPETIYNVGDYVQTGDGIWWINVYQSRHFAAGEEPGVAPIGWKRLSSEFTSTSSYEEGDVILYNSIYYRAEKDMFTWTPTPGPYVADWKELGKDKPQITVVCKPLINEQTITTVRNELDNIDEEKIEEYKSNGKYSTNDVVKVIDESGRVKYYIKINNDKGAGPGNNAGTGWKHLARDFDANSSYQKGDVVLYLRAGVYTITFKKDMAEANFNIVEEIEKAHSNNSEYITIQTSS